ncbi:hypothetical protein JTB14_010397 [Gonioctena quinquepunctata]|nr:hypothetical protein JTB14_010397 [Gonioctena quinquepunctata]
MRYFNFLLLGTAFEKVTPLNHYQSLENDGPIVAGASLNSIVTVYDGNDVVSGIDLKYNWKDDGIPKHTRLIESQNATDSWTVSYNASIYPEGTYIVQVRVDRCVIWDTMCYQIDSARSEFEITETLNGVLKLEQK